MCIIDCLGIRFFAIARVVVIRRPGVVLSIFYSQTMISALSHDHNDPCVLEDMHCRGQKKGNFAFMSYLNWNIACMI